jgi:ANTAR domain-containing protein
LRGGTARSALKDVTSDEQDVQAWRQRAEQLQAALDSRVVIEQAKGMLRERLGLPIDTAFQLLRLAARANGAKVHALAAEVVSSFATPGPIVRQLGLNPAMLSMRRQKRILETEEFFRQLNDVLAENGARDGKLYMCECANPYCIETIDVTAEDIQVMHSAPGYYLILPGHEIPEVEHVVHATAGYAIVTKDGIGRTR